MSVDANTQQTMDARLLSRLESTVVGLGVIGAVIGVSMQRSASLRNNFFIVGNMCTVFLPLGPRSA